MIFVRALKFCGALCALLAVCAVCAGETPGTDGLQPAFPNYALQLTVPEILGRDNPAGAPDTELPFSWPQTFVVREDSTFLRGLGGFDPGFQPTLFEILPVEPTRLTVEAADGQTGLLAATIRNKTADQKEVIPFRVRARGITNDELFSLTYDIRGQNTRIRSPAIVTRSPGAFIKPGQTVRYTWTRTSSSERRPKCEAEFAGKTGAAKGLSNSVITEVQSLRVQPMGLGHYLLTVTPRDVRGEPPRGSTSNGQVFRCAFGSENLPPVTDGFSGDNFLPAAGETITLRPNAVDPETGRSTFDNQFYDFGDGTTLTGVSGNATHAYAQPGIYRARCTVADEFGVAATAEENVIVGARPIAKLEFRFLKNITPEESGSGELNNDSLDVTFRSIGADAGDRIVFTYNRNRFGRLSASDQSDDVDIILKAGRGFEGPTRQAKNFSVSAGPDSITVSLRRAAFDRTGDPRLGRSLFKGVVRNQRIAVCVVPADGSTPRVAAYTGNIQFKVVGGEANRFIYVPEDQIKGSATQKEPDPRRQEVD